MRHQYKKNLKVGIFILSSIVLLCTYIMLLGDKRSYFSFVSQYKIKLPAVDGLFTGSVVSINGIVAGNVTHINFIPKTNNIEINISVLRKFLPVITTTSKARLKTKGLLGDTYITITTNNTGVPLPSGSYIPSDSAVDILKILSSQKTKQYITAVLTELSLLLKTLNSESKTPIKNISHMFSKKNVKNFSEGLQKLNSILTKIDNGDGTIGSLINNKKIYHKILSLLGETPLHQYLPNLINTKK